MENDRRSEDEIRSERGERQEETGPLLLPAAQRPTSAALCSQSRENPSAETGSVAARRRS